MPMAKVSLTLRTPSLSGLHGDEGTAWEECRSCIEQNAMDFLEVGMLRYADCDESCLMLLQDLE